MPERFSDKTEQMDVKTKPDGSKLSEPKEPPLAIEIYQEICNNIRVTDETSFKLLNIVPVISGIGATALVYLEKSQLLTNYSSFAVIGFSICGMLITFGLFRWELRNIQKCNWYIERAGDFELRLLKDVEPEKESLQFANLNLDDMKKTGKKSWGKTESEKLIYIVAIAVWLVPIYIAILHEMKLMGSVVLKSIYSA